MDLKKELLALVEKHVDLKGLVTDAIKGELQQILVEESAKTKTPLDDMAVATLAPQLEEKLVALLVAKIDALIK